MFKTMILSLLLVGVAQAAPFLVCDPYPASSTQPTSFTVTISGVTNPIPTPAVAVTGGVAMHLDLGPYNLTGARTLTVVANNLWGSSVASSPLAFTAGTPGVPSGLGLAAQ